MHRMIFVNLPAADLDPSVGWGLVWMDVGAATQAMAEPADA